MLKRPTVCLILTCIICSITFPAADEIRIGYFGPGDPNHPLAGSMWQAAALAIEQANEKGGYNGKPFKLIPAWSQNNWGTGVKLLTQMAYNQNVCAIIGGIDGPSTHLAEQVVAKAHIPLVSGTCTDKTANLANVPWMFTVIPGDHLQARALANAVTEDFILLSSDDHDSHLFTVELKKAFVPLKISPAYHFQFKQHSIEHELFRRTIDANPQSVIVIADLPDTAKIVKTLRKEKFTGKILTTSVAALPAFIPAAGLSAQGTICPLLYTQAETYAEFETGYRKRFGKTPDYLAAHTYDAVNLVIDAIRKAGPERYAIRETLQKNPSRNNVTGKIEWDKFRRNTRPVTIMTID